MAHNVRHFNKQLKLKIIEIFGTQADFARAVDENESFVSRVIRGRCEIGQVKRGRWAKILRCPPSQLFPAFANDAIQPPNKATS
jgi:hypothetical protein